MYFGMVEPRELDNFWPQCREILSTTFRDQVNCYTVDDYYQPIKIGAMRLWVASDNQEIIGAVATTLDRGSNMTICMVHSLAGKRMNEWKDLFDMKVTQYAKENGCKAVQCVGRKGFMRMLPNLVEDGTIYVRML